MGKPDLFSADCSRCAALCCMALAFDRGDHFDHDKAAGVGCHNLAGFTCGIHGDLAERGYSGCIAFDCLGAGQRVTELFERDWRSDPSLTGPMIEAFRMMREVQELRQLLVAAATLPLSDAVDDARLDLLDLLANAAGDLTRLKEVDPRAIRGWLRGLAEVITPVAEA